MQFALQRQGSLIRETVADPAAGMNWSFTLDPVFHVILHAVHFTLVTDATVANRFCNILIRPPTAEILSVASGIAVTASLTTVITYWEGWPLAGVVAASRMTLPLPNDFFIPRGSLVQCDVRGIAGADQISDIVLWFRKWGGAT
jgi:hypothetical protein